VDVQLGGNDFFGVPFPLVLADRFFHIYSHRGVGADGSVGIGVNRLPKGMVLVRRSA
jgi:hypothetical protein